MALEMIIELDRIPMTKEEILKLRKGTPIVLLKKASESVEIKVSGFTIGKGFLQTVGDRTVLEVSEVISEAERNDFLRFKGK